MFTSAVLASVPLFGQNPSAASAWGLVGWGIVAVLLAALFVVFLCVRFIPNNKVGIVEKLWAAHPLSEGHLIALSGEPFVRGMRLIAGPENKDAGWITSAAEIRGRQIALGYVKRGFNSAGTELDAILSGEEGRVAARVVGLPFSN